VRHEYHLVLGADHIGHTLGRRFTEAIGFLGRHLGPPEPDAAVDNLRMQLGMPTRKLQRDGATIGLHIRGEGPAVVLVPSLGRTARDFDNLAGRLAQGGYQAVGVDPRGLDNRGLRDDLTLHSLAGDVAAAIERVGNGPVHLVGHALGNRICRTLTADRPDLVTSLTLLAAGGLVEPAAEVSAALRRCFDLDASMDQRRADIALAFFASGVVPQSWVEGWHPAVALAQAAAVGRTKVADWWSATAQHILVIQGLQDTVARPENGRQYVAEIGAVASLVEIDGAGHALLPEQPDRVATELLAFFDHIGDRPNRRL
jgi:pimeloyl-ACP methyl ester carboxylesterase